jgi:hypothetical protein
MRILAFGSVLVLLASVHSTTQPAASGERQPSADSPRTDHALGVYDARIRRVVIIGNVGDPTQGDRDKVWSWSGTQWELVTDAGPPGRVNAAAAYEARRGRAIVAGGSRKKDGGAWGVVGDAWEAESSGWSRIADIASRDHHALVESGRGSILMFGGIPANRTDPWPNDTWELQEGSWKRSATEGPPGRGRTALAYDRRRQQVVLFGGVGAPPGPEQPQTFFNDTWIWNGKRWEKVADGGPPGRYAHGMVFDERAGVVLLYGGAAAHRGAPLGDMWRWDGERWTEIKLSGATPGPRYQPVMVYDRARARTVLYGGIGGPSDTWEWDDERWRQVGR